MEEQKIEQDATVKVGLIIEIPVKTTAETDEEFFAQLKDNKDINEAISQLVFSALAYRDSASSRSEHKVMYSKFVIFFDESTGSLNNKNGTPIKITWRDL